MRVLVMEEVVAAEAVPVAEVEGEVEASAAVEAARVAVVGPEEEAVEEVVAVVARAPPKSWSSSPCEISLPIAGALRLTAIATTSM